MEAKKYRKSKTFKGEMGLYYVEIDILKYYSDDIAKLTVYLYKDDKKELLAKDDFKISNFYENSTLDLYAKRVIEDFEDWKDLY